MKCKPLESIIPSFVCGFLYLTIIFGAMPSTFAMNEKLDVELDRLNYAREETALVRLTGPPSEQVSFLIVDFNDKFKDGEILINLDADGQGTYPLDLNGFAAGVYTAVVIHGTDQIHKSFSVGLMAGSGKIRLSTMKSLMELGDSLQVLGDTHANVLLTLSLKDPLGAEVQVKEVFSDKNGKIFEDDFKIPIDGKTGLWTITSRSGFNFSMTEIEVTSVQSDTLMVTVQEGARIEDKGKSVTINVTGASEMVNIEILTGDGEQIEEFELPVSRSGEFQQPWVIPRLTEPGTYTVKVGDAFNHAETTFQFPFTGAIPLSIFPGNAAFEEIPVGKNRSMSIKIDNLDQERIRLAPISFEGVDLKNFSLDSELFTLEPGASKTILIQFSPDRTGDFNASLIAGSDYGRITIPLSGVGIDPLAPGVRINFDKNAYTWTDKVGITIEARDWNRSPDKVDVIGDGANNPIVISTGVSKLKNYRLVEIGPDIGIFKGEVMLTGFLHDADGDSTSGDENGFDTRPKTKFTAIGGPGNGLLESKNIDNIRVTFRVNASELVTATAPVQWQIGKVKWLKSIFNPFNGWGVVRVTDPDMNLDPETLDNFDVDVWSDSDAGGIDLSVIETDAESGIFEGRVFFSVTDESSGHRLRVAEGDTVTTEYEDNTLPSPSTIGDELDITAASLLDPFAPPSPTPTIPIPQPRPRSGSVRLDRFIYPVPFGNSDDFVVTSETSPDNRSLFPIHQTGMNQEKGLQQEEQLLMGNVMVHVQIHDSDFNISPTSVDTIAQDVTGTGPVKISILRGGERVVLGYAGGTKPNPGLIDVNDDNPEIARQFGPINETVPDSGTFAFDLELVYTDGPADSLCPITNRYDNLAGDDANDELNRFDLPSKNDENYCILAGDVLVVEYTDPTEDITKDNSDSESAFFQLRNGLLAADRQVYPIGRDIVLTLIEPDLNLDNNVVESYDLDLIEWDSDAATVTIGSAHGHIDVYNPRPPQLTELKAQPGVFQTVIKMPEVLDGDRLERAEEVILEYTDWGPAGSDYVGDEDEDINLTFHSSNLGAKVILDKKVYSWTDKVGITIIAPDHNFNPEEIDDIGNSNLDPIKISTRGFDLDNYMLVETGPDTGIFYGEVILTGFSHDTDGDQNTGSATGIDTNPRTEGTGPFDGLLEADDDDGITVSFEYSEDETVVGSGLIRWNIGRVEWDQPDFGANDGGTVRVTDHDMNLNPEKVDSFEINGWSDTDRAGISILLKETNVSSGIFEGMVMFSPGIISSDEILRITPGDRVTVGYIDHTLPDPHINIDELLITNTAIIRGNAPQVLPPITFNQGHYSWTDSVEMTITAPDHNLDSSKVETIGSIETNRIRIATQGHELDRYRFTETGANTGIFKGQVTLTGFLHNADGDRLTGDPNGFDTIPKTGPTPDGGSSNGFLESWKQDAISVSFQASKDESLVLSAPIGWNEGEVQWLSQKFNPEGVGLFRVIDKDMNLHPDVVDFLQVDIWSDSNPGGVDLVIYETEVASGIFEGQVFFSANETPREGRLQVAEGDTITVEYEDNTLPPPFTTRDELDITATSSINSQVPGTPPNPSSKNPIIFHKNIYGWTDEVQISISSPEANGDPAAVDRIGEGGIGRFRIATSRGALDELSFVETAANSGIFTGGVTLSGFLFDADGNPETGDADGNDTTPKIDTKLGLLKSHGSDRLYASYAFDEKRIASMVPIVWNVAKGSWLRDKYPADATGTIKIIDPDMNISLDKKDGFQIIIWSDSDPAGITLSLVESDLSSGVFMGEVHFSPTDISADSRLHVSPGDTITAHYRDHTLPSHFGINDHQMISAITSIDVSGILPPPSDIVINLDKDRYSWTDRVVIIIESPKHNINPDLRDEIGGLESNRLRIATRGHQVDFYRLVEIDKNSGVFMGEITLIGFSDEADGIHHFSDGNSSDTRPMTTPLPQQGPKDGFIESSREDVITVSFKASEQNAVVATAPISWEIGKIEWLNDEVYFDDFSVFVRVTDRDMNLDPNLPDRLKITIRSELNGGVSSYKILETTENSGVFEDEVYLRTSGREFRSPVLISPGDKLSVTYEDRTLPKPHAINDVLIVEDTIPILPKWQTASVALDREVYPIPFGTSENFGTVGSNSEGHSLFPVHSTAITESIDAPDEQLPQGDLIVHIRIHDPDRNRIPTAIEEIAETIDGRDVGPLKVSVIRGESTLVLGYAGGPSANQGRIDVDDNDPTNTRQWGPINETAENSGIFGFDLPVVYTDGPVSDLCPATTLFDSLDDGDAHDEKSRFDEPSPDGQNYCILRGDRLLIEYIDPLDSVGQSSTVMTSAIFDLRSGILSTDKQHYSPHSEIILTLTDPDLNLNNEATETYNLDLIEWRSDTATVTLGENGGETAEFMPRLMHFTEIGAEPGTFQAIFRMPRILQGDEITNEEEVNLEYIDWGPSTNGLVVGEAFRPAITRISSSKPTATIELDKKNYSWTEKVNIRIFSSTWNVNPDEVEVIGDTDENSITISTKNYALEHYSLVETGANSGIFFGKVDLTGFLFNVDGNPHTGDENGFDTNPRTDLSEGIIENEREDQITIAVKVSKTEIVQASAPIRWNAGRIIWSQQRINDDEVGHIRLVDRDLNLSPDTLDQVNIRVSSESDPEGLSLPLTEVSMNSGIFEGKVFFATTGQSSGVHLLAAFHDRLTAEYIDHTLPEPFKVTDQLEITGEAIRQAFLFVGRTSASNPRLVDAFGNTLNNALVNQPINIMTDLRNHLQREQFFTYIIQIENEDQVIVGFSWITGSLSEGQVSSPTLNWFPETPGVYTASIFLWESIDYPQPLSDPQFLSILVKDEETRPELNSQLTEVRLAEDVDMERVTSPSLEQSQPSLSITTDKTSYNPGDNIVLSGRLSGNLYRKRPLTLQVLKSPVQPVRIDQFFPREDGSFSRTYLAGGPLWSLSGEYNIRVLYGAGLLAEAIIEFEDAEIKRVLTVDPQSIDFGSVEIGGMTTKNITLTNTSSMDLRIQTVTLNGHGSGNVKIDRTPFPLPAGERRSIKVRFVPEKGGILNSVLTFSDDLFDVNLNLKGYGTNPFRDILLTTDKEQVCRDELITVSGTVVGPFNIRTPVLLTIFNPDDKDFIRNDRISLKADGSFSKIYTAGGPLWHLRGSYLISVNHDGLSEKKKFEFEPENTCRNKTFYVNEDAEGLKDGTSWNNAFQDLQSALEVAWSGDEIRVASGIYTPDIGAGKSPGDRSATFGLKSGVAIYGGFNSTESSREQRDWEANETILSGDLKGDDGDSPDFENYQDNSLHVVTGAFTDSTTVLNGFTISGGNATGSFHNLSGRGGGMIIQSRGIQVKNCKFFRNYAFSFGGGVYSSFVGTEFSNCLFIQNESNRGGGFFHDGHPLVKPILENCLFQSNHARIRRSFSESSGGGLAVKGAIEVRNSFFLNNTAPSGAGMSENDFGFSLIVNSVFAGNSAEEFGGGLFTQNSSPLIVNCTFNNNSSLANGGAIGNFGSDAIILNSIIWNNPTGPEGHELFNHDRFKTTSITFSIIKDAFDDKGIWNESLGTNMGNNLGVDPLLGDIDGPDDIIGTNDDDFRLQPGSPAIDAGNNDGDVDPNTDEIQCLPDTDLAGNSRFLDDPQTPDTGNGTPPIADMGAYEFLPVPALIGHWRFDEEMWAGQKDEVIDDSGLDTHGTSRNGTQILAGGKINRAGEFDGDNDYIDLGSVDIGHPLQLLAGGTLSIWFNQRPGDRYQRILDKSTSGMGTNGFSLIADPVQKAIWIDVSSANYRSEVGVYELGQWTHVAAVITKSTFEIYINGVNVSGSFISGSAKLPVEVAANIRIGTWNHSIGREFNGFLDDLRIYNRALSSSEIAEIHGEGSLNDRPVVEKAESNNNNNLKVKSARSSIFPLDSQTMYEDAEDGTISGWLAYGDGNVLNVEDASGNRIISTRAELVGPPFRLGLADKSNWNNTEEFTAFFAVLMEEEAAIYFRVDTSEGEKYLCYQPGLETVEIDQNVICFGLGIEANGQWHTILRSLATDLEQALPGVTLVSIKDFFVFGSVLLDDLMLLEQNSD